MSSAPAPPPAKKPKKAEIAKSPLLQATIGCASRLKKDPTVKIFTRFVQEFLHFIEQEKSESLRLHYIPKFTKIIIAHMNELEDIETVLSVLKVLEWATDLSMTSLEVEATVEFFLKCLLCVEFSKIKLSFSKLFQSPSFSTKFSKLGKFSTIFESVFSQEHARETCFFVNHVLFDNFHDESFQFVNFPEFLERVIPFIGSFAVKGGNEEPAALFIAKLFCGVSKYTVDLPIFFTENDGFVTYDLLLSTLEPEVRVSCYKVLLNAYNDDLSQPPNLMVLFHIYRLFLHQNETQKFVFDLVYEALKEHPECAYRMNRAINFSEWFSSRNVSLEDAARMIDLLDQSDPSLVKETLPFFFKKLAETKTIPDDITCYDITLGVLERRGYNLTFLLDLNFLVYFVIQMPVEKLIVLLKKRPVFSQLIVDVFSLEGAVSYRETVIESVLRSVCSGNLSGDASEYANLITSLISVAPTDESMREFINAMKRIPSLVSILGHCFLKSGEASLAFVRVGGLDYIKDLEFSVQIEILANLVSKQFIPEVDEYLNNTKPNLDKASAEQLCYGNNHERYRHIRCPSLLRALNVDYGTLDPHNACFVGKHVSFEDPNIAKRYISPERVDEILDMDSATIIRYLCQANEPFPFYQLFPYETFSYTIPEMYVLSTSFWWKASDTVDSWSVIFRADGIVTCYLKNQKLRVETLRNRYSFSIDPLVWNYVSFSDSKLQVNELVVNLESSNHMLHNICFLGIPDSLLFVARVLYSSEEITDGYGHGVRYLSQNGRVVYVNQMHDSYVENYGFDFHLQSPERVERLIKVVESTQDRKKFEEIMSFFFEFLKRTEYMPECLWDPVLNLIDCHYESISNENFLVFVDLVMANANRASSRHFRNIVFHPRFQVADVLVHILSANVKWLAVDQFDFAVHSIAVKTNSSQLMEAIFRVDSPGTARRLLLATLQCADNIETCRQILEVLRSSPNTVKLVAFDELKKLMICSPELRLETFELMLKLESLHPHYIEWDIPLLLAAASLANAEHVWKTVIDLKIQQLLLVFAWAGITILVHATSYGLDIPDWVKPNVESLNSVFASNIHAVFNDKTSKDIILYVFPFCFNYAKLFDNMSLTNTNKPLNFGCLSAVTFLHDSFAQCFHYSADQLGKIVLPEPPIPPTGREYIRDVVSDLFHRFGFSMPFPQDFNAADFMAMVNEGIVSDLLLRVTISSDDALFIELLHSIIGTSIYTDRKQGRMFAFPFLHRLIHQLKCPAQMFRTLCIIHKTLSESFLRVNPVQFISDVMHLLNGMSTDKETFIASLKYGDSVLYDLFLATPSHSLQFAISVFQQNSEISKQVFSIGLDKWVYAFSLASEFCPRMKRFLETAFGVDSSILEDVFTQKNHSHVISRVSPCTLKILRPERVAKFYDNASRSVTKIKFTHAAENVILNVLFEQDCAVLERRIRQTMETHKWHTQLRLQNAHQSSERMLLNPFVYPARVPTIAIPFPETVVEFSYCEVPPFPVADMIVRNLLPIDGQLLRYQDPINCVCLCGDDRLILLTHAKLSSGVIEFSAEPYTPQFLREVEAGLYGETELWFSRIAIVIEKRWVMKCMRISADVLQLWTFTCGTFVIRSKSSDHIFRLFPFGGVADPKTIIEAILAKNYSLGKTFCDFDNFPMFPISISQHQINILCGITSGDEHFLPQNSPSVDSGVSSWYEMTFHEKFIENSDDIESFNQKQTNCDCREVFSPEMSVFLDNFEGKVTIDLHSISVVIRNDKLAYATSVSACSSGRFISVDYSFGLTEIFAITDGAPEVVSRFSVSPGQRSIVASCELVCGIVINSRVLVFHIITGALLHSHDFGAPIVAFDLHQNGIILALSDIVYAMDFNLNVVSTVSVAASAVMSLDTPSSEKFVVGTTDGKLMIMEIKNCHISVQQFLPSRHKKSITSLLKTRKGFISRSSDGICWSWEK